MKLLVTGGAGYIGSIVTRHLLGAGHQVTVLDSLDRGHRDAVAPEATFVQADLRNAVALEGLLAEGFDGVLHFAALALVGESVSQPGLYWENNVRGTLNLLDAMVVAGTPRLVFSSTAATYGVPQTSPITEDFPTKPVNPYGASKLAIDLAITDYAFAHHIGATSLRYFNVAGAHGHVGEDHEPETHLIPNILKVALGQKEAVSLFGTDYPTPDGTAVRDYVHVDDLAVAHLLAIENVTPGEHTIYNLGNQNGFSVRQVIDAAGEVTGKPIAVSEEPRRPGDPPELVASSEKIRAALGWTPAKPTIQEMIADAWQFIQDHPDGYSGH